ncbi:xylulose kinase 2 isoform X4 [Elaeis guineensis]|uniref:xylulose kinase 2 isoform X4 n=1 Tax=Elaeis guineensis var. tenera TaxID=51953 RepID=UPI003C6D85A0
MAYTLPKDSLYLGFDCSTQSLKATVLDASLVIVASEFVHFDSELPHYKTKDGVHRDPWVNGRIVSPTLMWVQALDILLEKLKAKVDYGKVAAISGSAQQHGTVYWKKGSTAMLASLDPSKPLVTHLGDAFSLKDSPIWMDCSTTSQCREIEKAVGGALELSKLTGSCAHERYPGPQIRKIFETQPEVYNDTERISLVSSFMASLLIGGHASIDETDGAGMNLMDIKRHVWSNIALEATAPGLNEKLGKLAPAYAVAGLIAPYFVERFQFKDSCLIIQWSGDNPNSLAGLALNTPGDLAISLGTSDTVFGITTEPQPSIEGHVFPNPVDPTCYMVMLVYKNGSLTREGGKLGFFYKEHEILPPLPVGCHRYVLESLSCDSLDEIKEHEVRAIIEGQFLSMRGHAERIGMPTPKRIIATGGASSNACILKVIANIFGCPIYTVQRPDSASLGAALRAAHGWLCNKESVFIPISCMYKDKLDKTSLSAKLVIPAGDKELTSKYTLLMKKRMQIEKDLVDKFGRS